MYKKNKGYIISRLSKRIIKRGVIIVVSSFLVGIILSFTILWPSLKKNTQQESSQFALNIANIIDTTLDGFSYYSRFVVEHYGLWGALDTWYEEPNKANYNEVAIQLEHIERITDIMRCVIIEDRDGNWFLSNTDILPEDLAVLEGEQYARVFSESTDSCWIDYYESSRLDSGSLAYVFNGILTSREFTIVMYFDADMLISNISNISAGTFSGYAVVPEGGKSTQWKEDIWGNAISIDFPKGSLVAQDNEGYYFIAPLTTANWNFIGYITTSKFNSLFTSVLFSSITIYTIACVVTVILVLVTVDRTIFPIKTLGDTMKRVSLGDLDIYADIQTDDEISELAEIFNKMIEELRLDIDERLKYERDLQTMKHNLLTAQIDSHAIYNTISTINSLVRLGRYDDAIKANSALAEILSNTLRVQDINVRDSLKQEVKVTNCFWELEKLRAENHARLIWDIPDELMELQIHKGLIQPLVENSIRHGLKDTDTGEIDGTVTVSVRTGNRNIIITVQDDGKGMPEEMLCHLNTPAVLNPSSAERGKHIGLANIKLRLSYIYGLPDCVQVLSDGGTTVILTLPLDYGADIEADGLS